MKLQALLGKQATDADIEEIKAEFHPSNTANVNIVPYEIYDEDGTEIVVGEVRKTIDGVKKSKPVYKKIITKASGASGNIATITDLEDLIDIYGVALYASSDLSYQLPMMHQNSTYGGFFEVSGTSVNVTTKGIDSYVIKATIKYTKTTDEWTAI